MSDNQDLTPNDEEEVQKAAEYVREKEIARQAARDAAYFELRREEELQKDRAANLAKERRAEERSNFALYMILGILTVAIAVVAIWMLAESDSHPTAVVDENLEQNEPAQPSAPHIPSPQTPVAVETHPLPQNSTGDTMGAGPDIIDEQVDPNLEQPEEIGH